MEVERGGQEKEDRKERWEGGKVVRVRVKGGEGGVEGGEGGERGGGGGGGGETWRVQKGLTVQGQQAIKGILASQLTQEAFQTPTMADIIRDSDRLYQLTKPILVVVTATMA